MSRPSRALNPRSSPFDLLSSEEKEAIRSRQAAKKAKKKKQACQKTRAVATTADAHPCSITMDQYFSACPFGLFSNESLVADERSVEVVTHTHNRTH